MSQQQVFDWIDALGVELVFTNDVPPYRLGCYLDDTRTIKIRCGLSPEKEQETLHHEYVHALHRDRSCHPAIEWRAWREAAKLIVDPLAYAAAERMSIDSSYIARELGTTTKIIEAYRKAIMRGEILIAA
ncbi:MAG: hypothetical protein JSS52_11370 [Proteobacteria bacterium]|nr:hypothetical protein [Pseudomonadota bacterium]